MTIIYEQVIKLIFSIIAMIFSAVILPWIVGTAIPWLKEKRLYTIIQKYVEAAEKKAHAGTISKEEKKAFVKRLLEGKGIEVDSEIDALIEAAVIELDNTAAHALFLINEAMPAEHYHDENGDIIIQTGEAIPDPQPDEPTE